MTESSLFVSPLGFVSLSAPLLWVTMSWDTPKQIHRFDNASASQEHKLVEDAVPGQTHMATNFWVGVLSGLSIKASLDWLEDVIGRRAG